MRIRGIPLKIHPSWFFIFIVFAWTAQAQVSALPEVELSFLYSWAIGFLTSSLLFLSVLCHEIGHALVALREGVKVINITLFFLGGVAKVERECQFPLGNFRIAFAGSAVSFVISILCLYFGNLFNIKSPVIINMMTQIGYLNITLALFNLLPVLPLDGGVILKSLVWYFTGSKSKGINVAIKTGRFLSFFAIFLGLWIFFSGMGIGGVWLVVMGWIGFASSRSQSQIIALQKSLLNIKVMESKSRRYRVFEETLPVRKLLSSINIKEEDFVRPFWLLVCNSGRWLGYINDKELSDLPVQYWDNYMVSDFTNSLNDLPSISQNEPLWKAVLEIEKSKEGKLLVLSSAGLPSGTLDRVDIGKSVLKDIGFKLPDQFFKLARKQNTYPLGMSLINIVDMMLSSGLIEKK